MADQGLELSRVGSIRENIGLLQEVRDTVRHLLRHIVFVAMFSLRLYALPLMYLCYKLSKPEDPWLSSTRSFFVRPHTLIGDSSYSRNNQTSKILASISRLFRTSLLTPLRIIKRLYEFGELIDQHPDVFRISRIHSSIVRESTAHEPRFPRIEAAEVNDENAVEEEPATASQVYHAALLNGNTLDNILAAFGSAEPSTTSPDDTHLPDPAIGESDRPYRRCNSSIQTTPERLMTPSKKASAFLGEDGGVIARAFYKGSQSSPLLTTVGQTGDIFRDTASVGFGREDSEPPPCHNHNNASTEFAMQSQNDENIFTDLKRCPTFVRRHANSRLPRSSTSGLKFNQHHHTSIDQRTNYSTSALSSPKRTKLQRRLKVYRDA